MTPDTANPPVPPSSSAVTAPVQQQNANAFSTGPTDAVHFLDYWQILYSRKEIVIAVALLLILTGIVVTRRMPRVYAAQTVIEVQRETPNIDIFGTSRTGYDPVFLRTQFEIIKSDPVIEAVVRESHLDDELGMAYGWKTTQTAKSTFERTVSLVKRSTSLSIYRDTDLIAIQVKLSKPDKPEGEAAKVAARVATAIARVFRDYTRNKTKNNIERALETLGDELKDLDRQITSAEEDLADFRAKNGVASISNQDYGAEVIRRQVADLTVDANRARMSAELKKARYERLIELDPIAAARSIQYVVNDSSVVPLLNDREQLELKGVALRQAKLGANHPDMLQNNAMLEAVEARIRQRVEEVRTGLKLEWEQALSEADMYDARLAKIADSERKISATIAVQLERKQKELNALKQRRHTIETRMDDERIKLAMPKTSVEIIEEAKVPEVPLPISPNFALNVTLSVAAGLFFGILLAFFIEYLDTTVKTAEDVERYLLSNVIGIIPQKIRALNDPNARSKHSEVYRVFRMNLKSSRALGGGRIILFTSASAGEGKSTTAFNTAWVCAECGERVLLVDADIHHPRQHKILNFDLEPGLLNVVVGEATLDGAIKKTPQNNLDFLPAGRISSTSIFGLMDTDEMAEMFKYFREHYDRVIVDAPPVIGVSDTSQLIRLCDGVVQIVQHRKYPRALCKRAKDSIVSMGGNYLGVVLNNVNSAHDSSSYYYAHQYYYYYYSTDANGNKTRRRSASHRRGKHRYGYDYGYSYSYDQDQGGKDSKMSETSGTGKSADGKEKSDSEKETKK